MLTVAHDIKHRHLQARLEEIFGDGVAIHKYEDHVGDLITVHSKQDVREAFSLYVKTIRKSKRDSVEPYLKLHLTKEAATTSGGDQIGIAASSADGAPGAPGQRRRASREKERDAAFARERDKESTAGLSRPISRSKSTPVVPTNYPGRVPAKSPSSSPPAEHGQSGRSKKDRDSTGNSPASSKKASGREKDKEKDKSGRHKRISWKLKDGKPTQVRRKDEDTSENGDNGGVGEETELNTKETESGDREDRKETSGSNGRGISFIRRLTPTKKKIERRKPESNAKEDPQNDKVESKTEDVDRSAATLCPVMSEEIVQDVESTDESEYSVARDRADTAESKPSEAEELTVSYENLELGEEDSEAGEDAVHGGVYVPYSPLLQHLPSGSPPILPTKGVNKRKKLIIQTDMDDADWDETAKATQYQR